MYYSDPVITSYMVAAAISRIQYQCRLASESTFDDSLLVDLLDGGAPYIVFHLFNESTMRPAASPVPYGLWANGSG